MPQIRLGQVDLATGEILQDATLAVFYPKRKNGFTEGWVAMSQGAMMQLAQAKLSGETMRVLMILLATLDFENYLILNQSQLAKQLGMHRPQVGRAIARLLKEEVLLQGPTIGTNRTFVLNPRYGWKGSAKGHQEALAARMKALGLSLVNARGGEKPA